MSNSGKLKDKNILIPGGAGFIGSRLINKLNEIGARVTVIDNFTTGKREYLKELNFELIEGNVTDQNVFDKIKSDIDFVVNLAAYSNPTQCEKDPETAFKINVYGTFNILNFALKKGVKKILFPSSCLLYGKHAKYLPIDEKHPTQLENNTYSVTKKIGEDMCSFFHQQFKLPVTWFRFFNNYGPGQQSYYFIPTLIIQAMKNKEIEIWSTKPVRDYVYVDDTAEALIKTMESDFTGGPVNIGSGVETSTKEVAEKIAGIFNAKLKVLNKDVSGPMRQSCDFSLAKKVLGWEAKTSFDDGLRKTIEWWRKHPEFLELKFSY